MKQVITDKLRNPDDDFLLQVRMLAKIIPLGLGFLITIGFLIIVTLLKATTDPSLIKALQALSRILFRAIIPVILVTYVLLKLIQVYVAIKLKKKDASTP